MDTAEHFAEAVRWHRRAVELDPEFGRAYMMLARSLYARSFHGFSEDVASDCDELCAAAEKAVALDGRDPYAHYAMSLAHFVRRQAPAALADAQRAIDLNPNLALAHMALGWARIFVGHFSEALNPLHMALRLSPNDPLTYVFLNRIGLAQYHLGNYEEAAHYAEQALSERRAYSNLVVLLASLGQLDRCEEAHRLIEETASARPPDFAGYWQIFTAYVDPAHHAQFFDGLQKAGLAVTR
jgi:tetratricopeptide (TPR) repeat protein